MIPEGEQAPTFELPGARRSGAGATIDRYRLEGALAEGPVLLNFYLFDFHPECTGHLCDLHEFSWFDFEEVTAFGVSADLAFSHRAFVDAEDLDVILLSDSDGSVAEAYGVLYPEFEGHRRIARRSVFLLDPEGTVQYAWSADDPSDRPNWAEVRAAVDDLDRTP